MVDSGQAIAIMLGWPAPVPTALPLDTSHRWPHDTPNLTDKATAYFRQWYAEKTRAAA